MDLHILYTTWIKKSFVSFPSTTKSQRLEVISFTYSDYLVISLRFLFLFIELSLLMMLDFTFNNRRVSKLLFSYYVNHQEFVSLRYKSSRVLYSKSAAQHGCTLRQVVQLYRKTGSLLNDSHILAVEDVCLLARPALYRLRQDFNIIRSNVNGTP